jgi:hypothetical protein
MAGQLILAKKKTLMFVTNRNEYSNNRDPEEVEAAAKAPQNITPLFMRWKSHI